MAGDNINIGQLGHGLLGDDILCLGTGGIFKNILDGCTLLIGGVDTGIIAEICLRVDIDKEHLVLLSKDTANVKSNGGLACSAL